MSTTDRKVYNFGLPPGASETGFDQKRLKQARAVQRTALEWLYPTCAVQGCTTTAWLEIDHRLDWASSHLTVFDLLDRLCSHHHDLKTHHGYRLTGPPGNRTWHPPAPGTQIRRDHVEHRR